VLKEKDCLLPIIFITGHGDIEMSVRAVKQGVIDFIEKPFRQEVLIERIEEALAENKRLRQSQTKQDGIKGRFATLTAREKDVMGLMVSGPANLSSKQIARELDISHRTVDQHRARVMEKMNAQSLPELVSMAKSCGLHTGDTV